MCFHVSLYISLALLSLAANRTTPDSATGLIHILDHGLGYLLLKSCNENTIKKFSSNIFECLIHYILRKCCLFGCLCMTCFLHVLWLCLVLFAWLGFFCSWSLVFVVFRLRVQEISLKLCLLNLSEPLDFSSGQMSPAGSVWVPFGSTQIKAWPCLNHSPMLELS